MDTVTHKDKIRHLKPIRMKVCKACTKGAANHTKKSKLLLNQDVRRWYDNMMRGSPLTAEGRLRKLGRFCEMHQMTPSKLADLAVRDMRTATDLLEDHITMMESNNYSPGYIEDHVNTVKSWFRHFDVVVKRRVRIASTGFSPTLQNERVPDAREMEDVYSRAGLRESVLISLMAKSGLRPGVIGNHKGTDGLQIRDLPDILICHGTAKCIRTPNRIIVRRGLSKAGHQYFTFSTQSATKQLVAYLNDRLACGETLHENSPVISPNDHSEAYTWRRSRKAFLPTQRISDKIRNTFRPKFEWRPYVLRAYFDTQLLIAESRGKIAHDFRVFFMGHRGTIESRYTTNKEILPVVLVNEMSDAFTRSEEYLDQTDVIPSPDPKQRIQEILDQATSHQIDCVLDMLTHTIKVGVGKPALQRGSSQFQ